MCEDIDPILERWGPGPGCRKIVGPDGREKVQLRVSIDGRRGILQFDCDGRPDGRRPHGRRFAFDHHLQRLEDHLKKGEPPGSFALSHEEARELIEEAVLVYQRYVVLLELGDYGRVVEDTERNMRLFSFLGKHAGEEEDRRFLEKWWPYIVRVNRTAAALDRAEGGDIEGAIEQIREARRQIISLHEQDDPVFTLERDRSMSALSELEGAFRKKLPVDEIARLEEEKREAVAKEDFARAAALRDRITELKERGRSD